MLYGFKRHFASKMNFIEIIIVILIATLPPEFALKVIGFEGGRQLTEKNSQNKIKNVHSRKRVSSNARSCVRFKADRRGDSVLSWNSFSTFRATVKIDRGNLLAILDLR